MYLVTLTLGNLPLHLLNLCGLFAASIHERLPSPEWLVVRGYVSLHQTENDEGSHTYLSKKTAKEQDVNNRAQRDGAPLHMRWRREVVSTTIATVHHGEGCIATSRGSDEHPSSFVQRSTHRVMRD